MAAAGSVKRMTRSGMGKCQGRYCGPIVAAISATAHRRTDRRPIGIRPAVAGETGAHRGHRIGG